MFSDDMVALFGAFLEGDDREYVRHDMANVGAEEVRYFRCAEGILEGYVNAAEALDACLYTVLAEAWRRAREARLIVEGYASAS